MEITDSDILFWNNQEGLTIQQKEDQLIHVVQICPKAEVLKGNLFLFVVTYQIKLVLNFRSVKELMRRYDLELTASTFLIIDSDQASLEIACEWQRCMGGQVCKKKEKKKK